MTIPANTLSSAPQRELMHVSNGLVYQLDVHFPPGPSGLAGIVICDGNYQVWPSTPGLWFHSDDSLIRFPDLYLKQVEPFQFDIWGYNEDTIYAHSIFVRVGLVSAEIFMARFLPSLSYTYFKKAMLEIEEAQEAERQSLIESPFPWLTGD